MMNVHPTVSQLSNRLRELRSGGAVSHLSTVGGTEARGAGVLS